MCAVRGAALCTFRRFFVLDEVQLVRSTDSITMAVFGTSEKPLLVCVLTSEMAITRSMPSVTVPKAAYPALDLE